MYSERQRVPLTWWLLCAGVVAIIAWQAQMQRPWWWGAIAGVLAWAAATWMLLRLSTTRIAVVAQPDGQRWLHAGGAKIPARLISRALVIPPTAKQAAMGRQLDPAAYVVHHGWIPTMAMAVTAMAEPSGLLSMSSICAWIRFATIGILPPPIRVGVT